MFRRWIVLAAAFAGGLLAVVACVGEDPIPATDPTDAANADAPSPSDDGSMIVDAGARCDPMKPFVAEEVTELNSPLVNAGARLSRDELTVYWHRSDFLTAPNVVPPTTLWVAKRSARDGVFGSLQPVVGLAKPDGGGDLFPTFLPNGDMIFHSDRGPGIPRDLYISRLVSGTFTTPVPFAPLDNPAIGERMPYVSLDGKELFIVHDDPDAGDSRLAVSRETSPGVYEAPVPFSLAGGTFEFAPVISADRLTLYFSRNVQMFMSRRAGIGLPWSPGQPLMELNVPDSASYPSWISEDGCVLYFYSNRPTNDPIARIFRGVRGK